MKNILLTGGTGYLGSKILHQLVARNYPVILLKRSFSNTDRIKELIPKIVVYDIDRVPLETIFCENSVDVIVHCATDYGREKTNPLHVVETNLIFPLALLESGKQHNIECFINTDTILDRQTGTYSLSKKQFKEWLFTYRKNLGCINIALEHFYGPGDNPKRFVTYIVDNLLKNADSIDLTKGDQIRDFVYIDDVVDAFIRIIDSSGQLGKGFHEFEIGTGHPLPLRDFVKLAQQVSGNTSTFLNFGAIPYRENETMHTKADTSQISRLGWKCTVSIEEGLRKMIESEKRQMQEGLS